MTARFPTGVKRRHRSPSPEPVRNQIQPSFNAEQIVGSRPRKCRRLQLPVVSAPPHVSSNSQLFIAPNATRRLIDVGCIDKEGPISPAIFAQIMDGILVQQNDAALTTQSETFSTSSSVPSAVTALPEFAHARSTDWWFPDGDIVLGVENLMFRVHKRVLSEHSVVFEDMFALGEASTSLSSDSVETLPRVQLYDSAAEWMDTLAWIYTGSPSYDQQNVPFSTVKSHLTLSNKYEMPILRHISQTTLERMYSLESLSIFGHSLPGDASCIANAPSALILAQQCDIPNVLPVSMYYLLTSHNLGTGESSLPFLDQHRGFARLLSVSTRFSTTLTLPLNMLPTYLHSEEDLSLCSIYEHDFHPSCRSLILGRWCAVFNMCYDLKNDRCSTSHPSVLFLHALKDLQRVVLDNTGAGSDYICHICNRSEVVVMQRTIVTVIKSLPGWFGL